MKPLFHGFCDELMKLAGSDHESLSDVVGAEALGPIPSAVKGYRRHGLKGALKGAGGYVAGGALGALGGVAASKLLERATGHDIGAGPVRASTVLPAVGALIAGLKGARLAGVD